MSEWGWTPKRPTGPAPKTPPPPIHPPKGLRKEVFADLFMARLRGHIADLFISMRKTPSDFWMSVIRGECDPAARDLAELGVELDVKLDVVVKRNE